MKFQGFRLLEAGLCKTSGPGSDLNLLIDANPLTR